MHGGDGGPGRPHAAPAVRHERRVAGVARSRAAGQAVRHHRRAVRGPPAAGLRHRQPAGARMAGARHRHQDARPASTDECLRDHRAACGARSSVDFERRHYRAEGASIIAPSPCSPTCRCGSAARRRPRSGAPRASAPAGSPAPTRRPRPASVVAAIKAAAAEAGRTIDEDHYGAGFPFHFGSRDAPASAGDGCLRQAHRPRRHARIRDRRRRGDPRARCRICRRRRVEVHLAASRRR